MNTYDIIEQIKKGYFVQFNEMTSMIFVVAMY